MNFVVGIVEVHTLHVLFSVEHSRQSSALDRVIVVEVRSQVVNRRTRNHYRSSARTSVVVHNLAERVEHDPAERHTLRCLVVDCSIPEKRAFPASFHRAAC